MGAGGLRVSAQPLGGGELELELELELEFNHTGKSINGAYLCNEISITALDTELYGLPWLAVLSACCHTL